MSRYECFRIHTIIIRWKSFKRAKNCNWICNEVFPEILKAVFTRCFHLFEMLFVIAIKIRLLYYSGELLAILYASLFFLRGKNKFTSNMLCFTHLFFLHILYLHFYTLQVIINSFCDVDIVSSSCRDNLRSISFTTKRNPQSSLLSYFSPYPIVLASCVFFTVYMEARTHAYCIHHLKIYYEAVRINLINGIDNIVFKIDTHFSKLVACWWWEFSRHRNLSVHWCPNCPNVLWLCSIIINLTQRKM